MKITTFHHKTENLTYCDKFGFCQSCIGIISRILNILLCKSLFFLFGLRNIDPLDLEDHWSGSIIAAGNHHSFVVVPVVHDGLTLQGGVNIPADGVLCLPAEFLNHQAAEEQHRCPLCILPPAPQVDFQVDFTRQNPSWAGAKRERKVLKTDRKTGNNAQ